MSASSFRYPSAISNPYSQPDSFDSALKSLSHSEDAPSLEQIRRLHDLLTRNKHGDVRWEPETARLLASYAVRLSSSPNPTDEQPLPEVSAIILTLSTAMKQWDDCVMYAVVVDSGQDVPKSIVSTLFEIFVRYSHHPICVTVLDALSTLMQSMNRLNLVLVDGLKHPSMPWWLFSVRTYLGQLSSIAIDCICSIESHADRSQEMPVQFPFLERNMANAASASILKSLLLHGIVDWLVDLSEERLGTLCQKCVEEGINNLGLSLQSISMSCSSMEFALHSLGLLSLIQKNHSRELEELDRSISTTNIVESVVQFSFPSCDIAPADVTKWTYSTKFEDQKIFGFDAILCWYICDREAWAIVRSLERYWRPFLENQWDKIIDPCATLSISGMFEVWFFHKIQKAASRSLLSSKTHQLPERGQDEICRQIISGLMRCTSGPCSSVDVYCLALLRDLLSDRWNLSAHDSFSRSLWLSIDTDYVEEFAKIVFSFSGEDHVRVHLLLCLDILNTFLGDNHYRQSLINVLEARHAENLIDMLATSRKRFDFPENEDTQGLDEIGSDTPPANNLSRLDDRSICVEQEESRLPTGFGLSIRLSASLVLARLGHCSLVSGDEGTYLLQSRICSSVNDFIAQWSSGDESLGYGAQWTSLDTRKRLFRLFREVAVADDGEFIAMMMFTSDLEQQKRVQLCEEQNKEFKARLFEALEANHKLIDDRNKQLVRLRTQNARFQREMAREKNKATQDSNRLLAMHCAERELADERASLYERRVTEAESELLEIKDKLAHAEMSKKKFREELENHKSNAKAELEALRRECTEQEAKAAEATEELEARAKEIVDLDEQQRSLEEEIHQREQAISETEAVNGQLHENLESLFGDLVHLAQVYQHQESENTAAGQAHRKKIMEAEANLEGEKKLVIELRQKEQNLLAENAKLGKKITKYKEMIEAENKRNAERHQRRGVVSYNNQLHQSQKPQIPVLRDAANGSFRSTSRRTEHASSGRIEKSEASFRHLSISDRSTKTSASHSTSRRQDSSSSTSFRGHRQLNIIEGAAKSSQNKSVMSSNKENSYFSALSARRS